MAAFKFPNPNKCTPEDPCFFAPNARVLALYNQYAEANGKPEAVRVSKTVQTWFHDTARNEHGWDGAKFVKEVGAEGQARGCLLWNGFKQANRTVLVVVDENDNDVQVIEG